jgi:hypothetical protein
MVVEQRASFLQSFLALCLMNDRMLTRSFDLISDLLEIQAHGFSTRSLPGNSEQLFRYCTACNPSAQGLGQAPGFILRLETSPWSVYPAATF